MLASDIHLDGGSGKDLARLPAVQKDLIGVAVCGPALSVANLKLPTSYLDEQPWGPVKETLL
jgi:hypothetical protein